MGRSADHIIPSIAEIKNEWNYNSTTRTYAYRGTNYFYLHVVVVVVVSKHN
jgi:hypothetical protein